MVDPGQGALDLFTFCLEIQERGARRICHRNQYFQREFRREHAERPRGIQRSDDGSSAIEGEKPAVLSMVEKLPGKALQSPCALLARREMEPETESTVRIFSASSTSCLKEPADFAIKKRSEKQISHLLRRGGLFDSATRDREISCNSCGSLGR